MPFNEFYFSEEPARPVPPHSAEFLRKRKLMLKIPVIAIPFLCFAFYSLGGGKGVVSEKKVSGVGFNTELPVARFDKKKPEKDKLGFYKQADQDSLRRREFQRMDPYYRQAEDSMRSVVAGSTPVGKVRENSLLPEDPRADELLQRLDKLKTSMQRPAPEVSPVLATMRRRAMATPIPERADSSDNDPQLEKLNGMLDKIIRIQHPGEVAAGASANTVETSVDPAAVNSLPAVVQENQVLVAGATIALRLTEAVRINGVLFPRDQLAYGVVSISNDRMLITINSIRREQSIFSMALQVYDLDGLPGIHIPGSLGRETAKESADQGIHSMGVGAFDPSLAGQAVNAGVLTARSLLSRKVRLIRVSVKAGYQVLLRSAKTPVQVTDRPVNPAADSIRTAPDPSTFIPFLHERVRHEKIALTLESIYLRDSLLWFVLRLENHSPIGYRPEYVRWCIRDRHQARRTAIQEITLQPLTVTSTETLSEDSSRIMLAAFRPFALPRDKELVLQLAERNGARELVMKIGEKELLKARDYERR